MRAIPRVRRVRSTEECHLDVSHDLTPSLTTSVAHGSKLRKGRLQLPFSPLVTAHNMVQAVGASSVHGMISHDNGSSSELACTSIEGDTTEQPRLLEEENVVVATISVRASQHITMHVYGQLTVFRSFQPSSRPASLCIGPEGLHDPTLPPLPSEEPDCSASVDRSESHVMASRSDTPIRKRVLFIDIPKTKDNGLTMVAHDEEPSGPFGHRLRALRRKKPVDVLQSSPTGTIAPEAIAISLNVHSSQPKSILKPTVDTSLNVRGVSQQTSTASDSTDSPVTPTEHLGVLPNSPIDKPILPRPVRIGHPTRPYYSAIRKNGISPTTLSRSTTDSPPPAPFPSRRQSLTPSTTAPPLLTIEASRRLSMSTMFYSNAYSPPATNGFSVFSLPDDDDLTDDHEIGGALVGLPPTPAPGARFSFSLPRRTKGMRRFSHGEQHAHAHTVSYARGAGVGHGYRGSGVGFSMSGQTELRMALAEGAASIGITEDGFRFSATTPPPNENGAGDTGLDSPGSVRSMRDLDNASQHGFMGRVRKLRKGLRDMLTTTTTTMTTQG